MIIPSLHRQPVPLTAGEHRELKLAVPITDWGFAGTSNALFIAAGEFMHAAREFPIVFVDAGKDEKGEPEVAPVVICGVVKDENLYVEQGRWRARYMPAVLRLYPFCIGHLTADQYALGIDASYSGLGASGNEALFGADGQPTPMVRNAFEQLQAFDRDSQQTRLMCRQLRELGLLNGARFDAKLPDGRDLGVDGFYTVDGAKLGELPDADVLRLHRSGMLALLHAHFVSLGHLNQLVEWHAGRLPAAAVSA